MYIYKEDLELNDQQWLICHKINQNQTKQTASIKFWTLLVETIS